MFFWLIIFVYNIISINNIVIKNIFRKLINIINLFLVWGLVLIIINIIIFVIIKINVVKYFMICIINIGFIILFVLIFVLLIFLNKNLNLWIIIFLLKIFWILYEILNCVKGVILVVII